MHDSLFFLFGRFDADDFSGVYLGVCRPRRIFWGQVGSLRSVDCMCMFLYLKLLCSVRQSDQLGEST